MLCRLPGGGRLGNLRCSSKAAATIQAPRLWCSVAGCDPHRLRRGQSVMGDPHTCPADSTTSTSISHFYPGIMRDRLGADGDCARSYRDRHEVEPPRLRNLLRHLPPRCASGQPGAENQVAQNRLSVRKLELPGGLLRRQGLGTTTWKRAGAGRGDLGRGISAARPSRRPTKVAASKGQEAGSFPDSFTHGTSAQRLAWFSNTASFDSGKQARQLRRLRRPRGAKRKGPIPHGAGPFAFITRGSSPHSGSSASRSVNESRPAAPSPHPDGQDAGTWEPSQARV